MPTSGVEAFPEIYANSPPLKGKAMKNVTNVLFVLLMVAGAGLVYAGKGVCVTPATTTDYSYEYTYYPSGYLKSVEITTTVRYPHMYCQGEEGDCPITFNSGAVLSITTVERIEYHDIVDNAEKSYECSPPYPLRGRTEC